MSWFTAEQTLEKARKKEDKERKNKIEETREKAIKGLTDFNKFIRDDVIEPGQSRSFDFKARNVKQEIIDSYGRWRRKKKARNLYKALTNDSKSVFYATNKITKTLVKKSKKLIIWKRQCFCKYF